MKVVSCKNCGAKYQLDDNDNVRDYECSACAGGLEFLESFPQDSSGRSVSTPKDDFNDFKLVYCTSCGLKYRLDSDDDVNDFECSSCYGDLKYVDEEINNELDSGETQIDENTVENELATNSKDTKEAKEIGVKYSNISANGLDGTDIRAWETQKELKLQKSLKEEFLNSVDKKYAENKTPVITKSKNEEVEKTSKPKDSKISSKDIKSPTKEIDKDEKNIFKNKDKIKKESNVIGEIKEESESKDKKSFKMEKTDDKDKSIKREFRQKIKKREISTKDKSLKTPKNVAISDKKSKTSKDNSFKTPKNVTVSDKKSKTSKRELVSNPKIKPRFWHDFLMELGLVIALVGVIDIVLTGGRLFPITFVVIGIIAFIVGLFLNRGYDGSKKREKLVREKLLTLPKDFYVLSYVRLPGADSEINHIVIGPTGIFTILTQEYKTKKNKKKPSLAISTFSSSKNLDFNTNRNTILNFDKDNKTEFNNNNEIKQKSIQLTRNLIEYLGENGLNRFYIEPLICFINKSVSIINIVLTDEDLFLEELLTKISNENVKLDYTTRNKCATLLSEYSAESS